jgi:hypothetical protein
VTEGWKIALFVSVLAIFLTIVGPKINNWLFIKHPDTIIHVAGYEHSYWIDELREEAPKRSKITIKPKKFPEGINNMEFKEIPVIFKKWKYAEDTKLFYVEALNTGKGIDKDIKIDISFPMNKTSIISSEVVNNDENVRIIQGGNKNSTRIVYKIDELLPNTRQSIEIITKGKEINEVKAWSGKELKEIKKIFIFDVVIEPDKNYEGPAWNFN